ncbi:MarR family winged helix-turn-helix transcriptional regulator [Anaerosporobacter faecicola]|uniref:MarR family winged helix-turn-helix transcriptional regulator n=1 Tax=Anaerosporobacter faecicola TaxID=2718714 RepID=UPI00143AF925|nr:MarR family winged helix-turn-helix transcriptional regulator [Anaerosporobacter faecicola]
MKLTNVSEEYAIYGTLFSLSNRIQTIGDQEFKGITLKQQFLMISIDMFEQAPTLREVGELIGCSYQNVKRMALSLEKEGFLVIRKDDTDKRKLLLVSTGKIKEVENANMEATLRFMKRLYHQIPKKDLVTTMRTLIKMDQNIGGLIEEA